MTQYLEVSLLGLGAGALYAALALGLVVAYRGSGVINLAHGAFAMFGAYTFSLLRGNGDLVIPPLPNPLALLEGVASLFGADLRLPDIPTAISLGGPMAVVPAVAIGVLMTTALGAVCHLLVFRPLRTAPPVARTVASVGVLLVVQAVIVLRFGTSSVTVGPILPSEPTSIGLIDIPRDRLYLFAVALLLAVVLALFFRHARTGKQIRAAAVNERGALLVGISIDRLGLATWSISAAVAGLVGILFAPISGLNPNDYVLFVIPALGAALAGRLESFLVAAGVGIAVGCAQSGLLLVQANNAWMPRVGAAQALPFVVIVIALIVTGKSLPQRGTAEAGRLPAAPTPGPLALKALIAGGAVVVALMTLSFDLRSALINSMIGVIISLSFVVVTGYAGQISLLQMSIAGLAALLTARWTEAFGVPFPINGVVAVLVAGACGVIAGLPALRLRGVQLAVATLGAAYAFENIVLRNGDYLRSSDASGSIPSPSLFGFEFGIDDAFPVSGATSPNPAFGMFVLLVTIGACLVVARLRRSDLGRRFLAVRSDERAAAAMGIRVARTKLTAFALAAALAGVAGVLSGYQFNGVTASPYVALASVSVLAIAYLGGIASLGGALAAGLLAAGGIGFRLLDKFAHVGEYQPLVMAVGLLFTVVAHPEGMAGFARAMAKRTRTSTTADPPVTDEPVDRRAAAEPVRTETTPTPA